MDYVPAMYATFWALVPPVVAIALALITKEVYSSLLAGCVVGALLTEGFAPWRSFETLFLTLMEGIDLKIFFFDVLLGAIVVLFARSGGSRAFGEWASRRVRSRRGAVTATAGLGCLIFLDDYFNCLTVGAIMQPITDRCRVSREKLSFIIDATAAPVCILAPISSWAAAVSSYIPADYSHVNGFALFIQAIPYNFYALLMLWLVFLVALTGRDFGPMYRREQLAIRQEPPRPKTAPEGRDRPRGRAVDLLVNCFSPLAIEEFRRVLSPGGAFVYVVPSEKHLWELKQVLYDRPYPNQVKQTPYPGFSYQEIRHVEAVIHLPCQEDIHALFQMTPYYWKTPRSGSERLAALTALDVTISFDIHVFCRD